MKMKRQLDKSDNGCLQSFRKSASYLLPNENDKFITLKQNKSTSLI